MNLKNERKNYENYHLCLVNCLSVFHHHFLFATRKNDFQLDEKSFFFHFFPVVISVNVWWFSSSSSGILNPLQSFQFFFCHFFKIIKPKQNHRFFFGWKKRFSSNKKKILFFSLLNPRISTKKFVYLYGYGHFWMGEKFPKKNPKIHRLMMMMMNINVFRFVWCDDGFFLVKKKE